jgi:putative transposase
VDKKDQFRQIGKDLSRWRRNLPHFQSGGRSLFVTWRCLEGIELGPLHRGIVLACALHFHMERYILYAAVVMPDHAHVLIRPLEKQPGVWWDLGELLKGIKGVSARRVNEAIGRKGSIWQDERYDRQIRTESDFYEKRYYIATNPVRSGLVEKPEDWDALWLPEITSDLLRE